MGLRLAGSFTNKFCTVNGALESVTVVVVITRKSRFGIVLNRIANENMDT